MTVPTQAQIEAALGGHNHVFKNGRCIACDLTEKQINAITAIAINAPVRPTQAQIEAALFAIRPSSLSVADMKAAITATGLVEEIHRQHKEIERLLVALTEAEKAALIGDAPHVAVICRRALKEKP